MRHIKIKDTDIFLENYEKFGQGKIIVSNTWNGSFSYVWGSMGDLVEDFIIRINPDYFAGKLCVTQYVFDAKGSVRNIRKHIREELRDELPFWKFMEAQKELRENISGLKSCENQDQFVHNCQILPDMLSGPGLTFDEHNEFMRTLTGIFQTEPWHFIAEKPSDEYLWLKDIHIKLVKELKGESKR